MSSRMVVIFLLVSWWNCATGSAGQLGREPQQGVQTSAGQSPEKQTYPGVEGSENTNERVVSIPQLRVPEKARKSLQKAVEAISKKQTATALRYIAQALEICPRYAEAIALRGVLERDG